MVGESSRETSHKRLLSEKTADGPCAQVCSWERSHEDLGKPRKGPVQESWGKRSQRPGLSSASGRCEQGQSEAPGPGSREAPATAEESLRASVGAAVVPQSE